MAHLVVSALQLYSESPLFIFRGEEFRQDFGRLQDLLSIFPGVPAKTEGAWAAVAQQRTLVAKMNSLKQSPSQLKLWLRNSLYERNKFWRFLFDIGKTQKKTKNLAAANVSLKVVTQNDIVHDIGEGEKCGAFILKTSYPYELKTFHRRLIR